MSARSLASSPLRRRRWGLGLALSALLFSPQTASAGAYIFAGELNGVDLILHPQGYTGTQNALTVEVCIDPGTLVPAGAVMTDMEQSVRNNIAIWNQLQPTVGNLFTPQHQQRSYRSL